MVTHSEKQPELRWDHRELPWDAVDRGVLADRRLLFYMLAVASVIEITSDIYTGNLVRYFEGDDEVGGWLANGWEPEELQHGAALKHYVQAVWPDFDWDDAYRRFHEDYVTYCRVEYLGPTRALEMARRCVVETGTCSYYAMIGRAAPCPVLRQLAENIRNDEANHYRHFYDYFQRYRQSEKPPRRSVLKALVDKSVEINGEDGLIAFRHVWQQMNPGRTFHKREYRRFERAVLGLARRNYPFRLAANMGTRPLGLPLLAQQCTDATLAGAARAAARVSGRAAATVD